MVPSTVWATYSSVMAPGRTARLWLLPLLGVGAAVACGRPSAERLDEEGWRQAESLWRRSEPNAYQAWQKLDPERPFGRVAGTRLRDADVRYRLAVEIVRTGQPGLREPLVEALALAPMDPALHLPFARACRDRGSAWRAADLYRRYLASHPVGPDPAQSVASALRATMSSLTSIIPSSAGRQASIVARASSTVYSFQ